ncbi:ABC transporter permease [Actinocrinis sp.]|uniref:ABC transporter permease n=1 Tax=Actinocrinis sp. TaxID=1920516 RepID=UPI002D250A5A|nr:ABC transporter permease [Actinocrinis sp.]HZP54318.1 ABC transporter permease [Actinocrinis sp.]
MAEAGIDSDTAPAAAGPPAPPRGSARAAGGAVLRALVRRRELSIVLVTIAAVIYFTVAGHRGFNTTNNYHIIMQYFAPWAIIGGAEALLLICGEIDLSAGFVYTFTPFALTSFYDAGATVPLALIGALAVAAGVGLLNGLIRVLFNLSSFIVTLGMGFFLEGMSYIQSRGEPVPPPIGGGLQQVIGGSRWSELIWALAIVAVLQIALSATRYGVYIQAAGGNPLSAAESGIKVGRVKVATFMATSLLAGFTGILDQVRVGSFDPTSGGNTTMFMAVASAVIGGTALLGGSGTVIGAMFGALLLGIINDGFNLIGVNAYAFDVVIGIAVVVAMLLNVYLASLRKRALR